MNGDRITRVTVKGLRCIRDVAIDLRGMTVLIGENGSGKSTVLEAIELLRLAADVNFAAEIDRTHGGILNLVSFHEPAMELGISAEGPAGRTNYRFRLRKERGGHFSVEREDLYVVPPAGGRVRTGSRRPPSGGQRSRRADPGTSASTIILRSGSSAKHAQAGTAQLVAKPMEPQQLMISAFGAFPPHPEVERVLGLLRGIEVHAPFEIRSEWVSRALNRSGLRDTEQLRHVERLSLGGLGLANVYHRLKNERSRQDWDETLDIVRLGLGAEVEDVRLAVPPGGMRIGLEVKYRYLRETVPASALSDGTLAYLAFTALSRLNTEAAILAFDEPETHLHPGLLARVVELLEEASSRRQVIVATHSDRLLDALSNPAEAVVLTELDARGATRLARPDPTRLATWLNEYRGIGDLRAAGHAASVMRKRRSSSQARAGVTWRERIGPCGAGGVAVSRR